MSELRKDPVLAYIGIGSNLDDPQRQVESAITMLNELPAEHTVSTPPTQLDGVLALWQ